MIDTPLTNASVFIDGEFKGTAGQSKTRPIVLPIEEKPSIEVALRLTDAEAGEARAKVQVKAGQRTIHKVPAGAFTSKNKSPAGGGP